MKKAPKLRSYGLVCNLSTGGWVWLVDHKLWSKGDQEGDQLQGTFMREAFGAVVAVCQNQVTTLTCCVRTLTLFPLSPSFTPSFPHPVFYIAYGGNRKFFMQA